MSAETMPETLYHYCGVAAFHGILETKTLRLSHAYYMNDYKEHQWLIDQANEYVIRKATESPTPYYEALAKPFEFAVVPYIGCFSSDSDSLSQWRAYAENGAGFAVGFSTKYLERRMAEYGRPGTPNVVLRAVEYDLDRQRRLIEATVAAGGSSTQIVEGSREWELMALVVKGEIWRQAARCKNPAFAEEKEWRIIHLPYVHKDDKGRRLGYGPTISSPGFRVTGERIVPFFEFDFGCEIDGTPPITRIQLGPKNYAREEDDALRLFLLSCGYGGEDVQVSMSAASYR